MKSAKRFIAASHKNKNSCHVSPMDLFLLYNILHESISILGHCLCGSRRSSIAGGDGGNCSPFHYERRTKNSYRRRNSGGCHDCNPNGPWFGGATIVRDWRWCLRDTTMRTRKNLLRTTYDGREKAPDEATEERILLGGEPLGFFDAWQSSLSV